MPSINDRTNWIILHHFLYKGAFFLTKFFKIKKITMEVDSNNNNNNENNNENNNNKNKNKKKGRGEKKKRTTTTYNSNTRHSYSFCLYLLCGNHITTVTKRIKSEENAKYKCGKIENQKSPHI